MPLLPAPPALPERDHGWLAQTLPMVASMASIGILMISTGHRWVALLMITSMGLGVVLQISLHRRRWAHRVATQRRAYDVTLATLAPAPDWAVPESLEADPVCRVIAARRVAQLASAADLPVPARAPELSWQACDLRVELAQDTWLDLREAAVGGVGPHGLIVGATGSGKSELLRALVLGLALRHPPHALALLLIDFKGGAGLADLAGLPHCAGLITNLEGEVAAVPRMVRALEAEIEGRERAVRAGTDPTPLVIVIDEFSELLSTHPDVLALLIRIGRVGRSLRLHLVLASQRLDETRARELEAHLSWQVALRTFTAAESRAVIGTGAAADLPREPGWALVRSGPEEPLRVRIQPVGAAFCAQALSAISDRRAAAVNPIWLPPLTHSPRSAELRAAVSRAPEQARVGVGIQIPIGVNDDAVAHQPVWFDPGAGHVAIVGRPGSGKSSLLDTIDASVRALHPKVSVLRLERGAAALPDLTAPPQPATPIILLVDDLSILRQENPLLEDALVRSALTVPGVRLIVAAHRWADVRPGLRELLHTRIELRLADPFDSLINRHLAAHVPVDQPGRGLIESQPFLAALP